MAESPKPQQHKPAAAQQSAPTQRDAGETPQEPDIDAGAAAHSEFEPDPAKSDWENLRDQRDEAAMAAYGRPYAELSNVEQTTVHTGFDTGASPQNPAGAAGAPVEEEVSAGA